VWKDIQSAGKVPENGLLEGKPGEIGTKAANCCEKSPHAPEAEIYPEQLQPLTADESLGSLAKERAAGIKEYLVKNTGLRTIVS
jgi:hypothetical protein